MKKFPQRLLLLSIGVSVAASILALAALGIGRAGGWAREAVARGQIHEFQEWGDEASKLTRDGAISRLRYVLSYYPSGTKQVAGSDLDIRVEEARGVCVGALIDRLRNITGEEFGSDPDTWLEALAGLPAP